MIKYLKGFICVIAGISITSPTAWAASSYDQKAKSIVADVKERRLGGGSRNVFGGGNPSRADYQKLKQIGMTCFRAEIQYQNLFPAGTTLDSYKKGMANGNTGPADPSKWNWKSGVYGDNFVEKAHAIGADAMLLIWNPWFNSKHAHNKDKRRACRSTPVDYDVWVDVLKKVVLHFNKGGVRKVDYIEIFNEPEHERIGKDEVYYKCLRLAKEAMMEVAPDVLVGGVAFSGFGTNKVEWMLKDPWCRNNIDFVSGHKGGAAPWLDQLDGKNPKGVLNAYQMQLDAGRPKADMKMVRSEAYWSTQKTSTATNLFHHATQGVEFIGFWEIQPQGGSKDNMYWFKGKGPDDMVPVAQFYAVMSKGMRLGEADFHPIDLNMDHLHSGLQTAFAAINSKGNPVAAHAGDKKWDVKFVNTGLKNGSVKVEVYKGSAKSRGWQIAETLTAEVKDGTLMIEDISGGGKDGIAGIRVVAQIGNVPVSLKKVPAQEKLPLSNAWNHYKVNGSMLGTKPESSVSKNIIRVIK